MTAPHASFAPHAPFAKAKRSQTIMDSSTKSKMKTKDKNVCINNTFFSVNAWLVNFIGPHFRVGLSWQKTEWKWKSIQADPV